MATSEVRTAVAAEMWTAFTKASVGALGLALLALGPVVPAPAEFPALRAYAFVAGALLVLWGASARHRPLLTILGCIALSAGLAASIVGGGEPLASRIALSLHCGAAVLLGAVVRRPWAAVPFLAAPVLIVASLPTGWGDSHTEFAEAWHTAMDCDCLWPGVPAALALAGAIVGQLTVRPWPVVKPSALGVLVGSLGAVLASLVVASLLPDGWAGTRTIFVWVGLLAGSLAWVALAYHSGLRSFVGLSAAAGVLVLVGQVYADRSLDPIVFDTALLATLLAALVPGILAAVGLLVRMWIGVERDAATSGASPIDLREFVKEERTGKGVYRSEPLHTGGFGAYDRPDEAGPSGSDQGGGSAGRGDG